LLPKEHEMPTTSELLMKSNEVMLVLAGIDPDDEQALEESLAALDAWIEESGDKIGACRAVVARLKSEEELLSAEIKKLSARKRARSNERQYVLSLATALLEAKELADGEAKVRRPDFSAWLQTTHSLSCPEDSARWPSEYTQTTTTLDKARIRKALKSGELFDGFALVEKRGVRFR
jgi:hypothetical protein